MRFKKLWLERPLWNALGKLASLQWASMFFEEPDLRVGELTVRVDVAVRSQ